MASVGSVWKWDDLMYDYYTVPGPKNLGGFEELDGLGRSKPQKGNSGIGIDIEQALPILPANSRRVGSGSFAKGRIYRTSDNALSGLGEVTDSPKPASEKSLLQSPWVPALLGASPAFVAANYLKQTTSTAVMVFFLGFGAGLGIGVEQSRWE
mgnify:CR=1 FL=1